MILRVSFLWGKWCCLHSPFSLCYSTPTFTLTHMKKTHFPLECPLLFICIYICFISIFFFFVFLTYYHFCFIMNEEERHDSPISYTFNICRDIRADPYIVMLILNWKCIKFNIHLESLKPFFIYMNSIFASNTPIITNIFLWFTTYVSLI